MAARIVEVRNALAAVISAWWTPSNPDAVLAPWRFDIDSKTHTGRKVYVFPSEYGSENIARGFSQDDYAFVLLVVEKYDEQGFPPDAWTDERVEWCESLLGVLGDPESLLLSSLWAQETAVSTVFDLEELTARKLFLSVLNVTYRERP
jgi:hypothetical protein